MRIVGMIAVFTIAMSAGTALLAQTYPAKPVRVIVPFAPGGGLDAIMRMVASSLSGLWGQTVAVENQVGAGGTVGSATVAKSPPDGHTLLANSSAHVVSAALLTNLSYDPLKDFVPVAPLTSQAYVLVVGKGSGFATMRDLIAAAKAKPGELTFSSAGIGSGTHLLAEKFNLDAGVRMIHVPTAGAGAANKEIIEGRITYWFSSLTPALPHLREGRLLALAVSGGKRMAGVPDVPTVAEAGISGFDSGLWYGIWAPAGIPNAIVDKIARDVSWALAMPESREHIAKSGAEAMSMTPAEFAHLGRGEAESAARIVKAAGIKPQ